MGFIPANMIRVTVFDRLAQSMSEAVAGTSAYAPAVLLFASFIEYVFPPFPGDTVVLLGAWYAVQGVLSWPMTFAMVTVGAVAGALVDYQVGARLGRGLERNATRRGPLTVERLARFEVGYRRWGTLILVANRFLPGVRAFLFVAAGAARVPLGKVLLCGAVSAALWNALLLFAGALLARNLHDLGVLFARYTTAAWVVLAAVALLLVARALVRARARAARRRELGR